MGSTLLRSDGMTKGGDLRTRDLLGSCWQWTEEVDLDLQMSPLPSDWEKRLDVKSGKACFHHGSGTGRKRRAEGLFQDLNFPESVGIEGDRRSDGDDAASRPLAEHDFIATLSSTAAEEADGAERGLGSNPRHPSGHGGSEWQSVCTLDKVKNALRRAREESEKRKVSDLWRSASGRRSAVGSPTRGSLSPAVHNSGNGSDGETSLLAAGCPRCLLYVLLPKTNPRCPRCGYLILSDSSAPNKRPRLLRFEDDRAKPTPSFAAGGTRSSHLRHPFDLNTVSF